MPTSVRLDETDEARFRRLAELQKISLAEWMRRALSGQANRQEQWIEEKKFLDAGDKGYIFIEELPETEKAKINSRKKT